MSCQLKILKRRSMRKSNNLSETHTPEKVDLSFLFVESIVCEGRFSSPKYQLNWLRHGIVMTTIM